MMDLSNIVQLIGTLGFPIAACIYLFYSMQREREQNAAQREADRLEHKAEMDRITDALKNNTLVMQKLVDTLTQPFDTSKH